ncbi:MAG: hypothetical protein ACLTKT_04355 [Clostridia bacterium]|mgnify:CR=1 FL=1|nr:hypothetical protein [Clostridium sp.]MBS6253019.1 hypothetical protein [Clostridium sp.]
MEIYDLMYSKYALYIYTYLFSNKKLDKEKETRIKNIIYITYMYSSYYEKDKSVQKFYEVFKEINSLVDIDSILSKDIYLNQFYQLFKLPKDISQESMKNEYELCWKELKEIVLKTNIEDILYFIKIKNNLDEIYEKIYNDNISTEELEKIKNTLKEQLEYLKKYLPDSDIEKYKTYFKVKNKENINNVGNLAIKLFELKKSDVKFSELKQLEDLKNKTHSANSMKLNNFENIEIDKKEEKQISSYAIKKILKDVILLIIFYFIIGRLGVESYKNFIETKNGTMLIPISICLIIIAIGIIDISKYIFAIFKIKSNYKIKGITGFIGDITWSQGDREFYNIYFPKYDTQYSIRTNLSTKKLERKSAVKLIKIASKKIVIKMS